MVYKRVRGWSPPRQTGVRTEIYRAKPLPCVWTTCSVPCCCHYIAPYITFHTNTKSCPVCCSFSLAGRAQGVRTPPPPWDDLRFSNTTGKKNYLVYYCWSRARDECTPSWKKSWIRPCLGVTTSVFCTTVTTLTTPYFDYPVISLPAVFPRSKSESRRQNFNPTPLSKCRCPSDCAYVRSASLTLKQISNWSCARQWQLRPFVPLQLCKWL